MRKTKPWRSARRQPASLDTRRHAGGPDVRDCGPGGYVGAIRGAIIVTLLQNVLSVEDRSQADQQILFGVIVLIILLLYRRESKVRE